MKYLLLLAFPALLFACGGSDAPDAEMTLPTSPPVTEDTPPVSPTGTAPLTGGDELFPWVDGVNVRRSSSTDAKRVARVLEGEALTYTGNKSANKETIVLRGVAYKEPWYEVMTKDNVKGWIFGGAVRQKDEQKGNKPPSDTKLYFPYFGTYDLSEWTKKSDETTEEGDATTRLAVYTSDGKTMTITETSVGEYGYTNKHTITDPEGTMMLERTFEFETTPNFRVVETVDNRIQEPAERHVREQELDKHYIMLKDQPVMANGPWITTRLD